MTVRRIKDNNGVRKAFIIGGWVQAVHAPRKVKVLEVRGNGRQWTVEVENRDETTEAIPAEFLHGHEEG